MSKLYARAKVLREHAEYDYARIGADDAYLDSCCYALQQCIEFTLKYIVMMHGEPYAETHDVRAQLNSLKKLGVELPCFSFLKENASTLNSWEAETRYNDGFLALLEDIQGARKAADELLDFASTLVMEITEES